MRHFAMTGIDTVAMISRIFLGEAMRATPPSARICAGTRSRAITATAPAFSAMEACSAFVTSMITPPFSISAKPVFRRRLVELPLLFDMCGYRGYLFASAKDEPATQPPTFLFYRAFIIRGTAAGLREQEGCFRRENSLRRRRSVKSKGVPFDFAQDDKKLSTFYIFSEHLFGVDGYEDATAAS